MQFSRPTECSDRDHKALDGRDVVGCLQYDPVPDLFFEAAGELDSGCFAEVLEVLVFGAPTYERGRGRGLL